MARTLASHSYNTTRSSSSNSNSEMLFGRRQSPLLRNKGNQQPNVDSYIAFIKDKIFDAFRYSVYRLLHRGYYSRYQPKDRVIWPFKFIAECLQHKLNNRTSQIIDTLIDNTALVAACCDGGARERAGHRISGWLTLLYLRKPLDWNNF